MMPLILFAAGVVCGMATTGAMILAVVFVLPWLGLDGPRDYANPDASELRSSL